MNICIIHDSERGNGEKLAKTFAGVFESSGHTVNLGHRSTMEPRDVAENPPDLLMVGAAVRRFLTSPPTKGWISQLKRELQNRRTTVPRAALFLTHIMPDPMVERRANRLRALVSSIGDVKVHTSWFSGQVVGLSGPFLDGTLDRAREYAKDLLAWVDSGGDEKEG